MTDTPDFLVEHAYRNVWCSPEQDYQHIIAPARLTPPRGTRGTLQLLWSEITLPTQGDWYHVYQIGEITPKRLGLDLVPNTWVPVPNQLYTQKMLIDLYTDAGVMIPRYKAYLLNTLDGNVVLAIQDIPQMLALGKTRLYMRVYANAYFNRSDAQGVDEGIFYRGTQITTTDQRNAFLAQWQTSKAKKGRALAWINGFKVQDLNTTTVALNDYVEFVRDSSIRQVLEFPVKGLPTFLSSLDQKTKYLLHYPGDGAGYIDYSDDLELFLIKRTNANIYRGVYYHRNQGDAVRMVTHKDYSIPSPYVQAYTVANPDWAVLDELTVQVYVRDAGYQRPLVDETNRIKQLYKLPDEDVLQALIGVDAVVPAWTAEHLESSMYPALMRAPIGTITHSMVEQAYGYHIITKLAADIPQKLDGQQWVELPYALRENSTLYEYDQNGVLVDVVYHAQGRYHVPINAATQYVEGMVGKGAQVLSTVYAADAPLLPRANYRCYVCSIYDGVPKGDWKDVTGDSSYYDLIGGIVTWKVDPTLLYTAVRFDDTFLGYSLTLDYRDKLLRFSLNVIEKRSDGYRYTDLPEIPFRQLDLWLNGHPLIEGLDYYVNWPEIVVVNKQYRIDGVPQVLMIRGMGFPAADLTWGVPREYGFVDHGVLSKNHRYNVRDDKVVRVVCGGRIYDRRELVYAEADSGVRIPGVVNGMPYQISEPIIPLPGLAETDVYVMRDDALAVDDAIEAYLTQRIPEATFDTPNAIPDLYMLYSPFCAKLIYDLTYGLIAEELINDQYGDMFLKELCAPYEWLLKYEPSFQTLDRRYVSIHPHEQRSVITLGVWQYRFLSRAIHVYLNDAVDISRFVQIETGYNA